MLRPVRIRNYISILGSMGISAEEVLLGTGIDATRLQDPGYLIDAGQCKAVISNMIRLRGDTGIGFDIGGRADLPSLGITGYALVTCRIVRETLEVWHRYSEPLLGIMSKYEFESDKNGDVVITFVDPVPAHPIFVFCVEELLALTSRIGELECGVPPEFVRMEFPYPPPVYRRRYEDIFRCPIQFNASRARVTLAKHWLNLPLLSNDEEFHRICLEHCGHIVQQIRCTSPIGAQLRHLFLASPQNIPNLDAAARELGMSSRTLRRRLQDEGRGYQSLVRDFRSELAREYLRSNTMSSKEVTYLLGFSDVHSFRRAFKMWTGQTANEYRSSVLQNRRDEDSSTPTTMH
jgi:AraC-like DNA-binding protein